MFHVVGVAGVTDSHAYRAGQAAWTPSVDRSQFFRSARWSARVLPDHLRETSTRRPA